MIYAAKQQTAQLHPTSISHQGNLNVCVTNIHVCEISSFFLFFFIDEIQRMPEKPTDFTNTNQNLFPESEPINELHSEIKMAAKKQWKVVTGTVVGQSESIRYHVNT